MWSPTHVQVTVQRAKGLLTKGKHQTNDCFVTIALGKEKYQTSVKEKASENVEWHEECELQIPSQGNKAEIVLTALHRNFLGVDEFLGMISVPLASFDVYERPRNRWYTLECKPGKENTKNRGTLEVKIGFIVKAGSLTDLTRKERHKSSLGQLSTAAQSIGGSLLSIGSLEKRKGLKKLAKSIGNRVKGKSKSKLDKDEFDEVEEHQIRPSRQEPGEADPGVISEDDDEFTFDDLSHKSSASSLNAPVSSAITPTFSTNSNNSQNSFTRVNTESSTPPPVPSNVAPNKPPRITSSLNSSSPRIDERDQDEWGRKLYGLQGNNVIKRWDNKGNPKIVIEEPSEKSPATSPSPTSRFRDTPEPPSPAPREIITSKRPKDDKLKERNSKDEKHFMRDKSPNCKEDKYVRSLKEDKSSKKDKKRDKENKGKDFCEEQLSSERIIIGGEDGVKNNMGGKSRLPLEVLQQFEGKTREDLIELTLKLQSEVIDKRKRLADLEDYIDGLLLRVIECSPRLLQNPYQSNRRLSSPSKQ
ncbi:rab11 family-interacting protein 2 [Fopius arisanus]|uniref:Rab11 family-interacting protein 2 n=1 Tax=Fopius arisanus TaxID=64838 RepID=A0A9R1TNK5_9HYME|nr:PREDICTED: rab11 family-interacting protein 2 [Fopius arisanus]